MGLRHAPKPQIPIARPETHGSFFGDFRMPSRRPELFTIAGWLLSKAKAMKQKTFVPSPMPACSRKHTTESRRAILFYLSPTSTYDIVPSSAWVPGKTAWTSSKRRFGGPWAAFYQTS